MEYCLKTEMLPRTRQGAADCCVAVQDKAECANVTVRTAPSAPRRSHWQLPAASGLALVVVTLLVYVPVRHYSFVDWDDFDYVSQNDYVKGGLSGRGLVWAFTQYHSANWHPLTWMSHMVDC